MTCDEIRSYAENQGTTDHSAAVLEHMDGCASCRRWADAQQEVRRRLELVRYGAPDLPVRLDSEVFAAYRQHVQQPPARIPIPAFLGRVNWTVTRFAWAAVGAAMLAVVLFVGLRFGVRRVSRTNYSRSAESRPASVPQPMLSGSGVQVVGPTKGVRSAKASVGSRFVKQPVAEQHEPAPSLPVVAGNAPSADFQNLMYCDPLSCPGGMEIIRMQLPASALNRGGPVELPNSVVLADVLVGPDGVARAIRIVN